jgi:glycosyltransferase involved in cell wall biosynthesis
LNPLTWLTAFWRIRRYRPDIIILQWWTTFWAPVWFALGVLNRLFLRRPLVIVCHNVLPHEMRWWDLWLARVALRWGTQFVVQSVEEKGRLLALIPEAHVDVIPHPIYDMFADQRIPKAEARQRLSLPPNAHVLLFFGIVREYKGLQDILVALPQIRERLGEVILVVAGEFWGDKRPYLEMIERVGIGDSVVVEDRYIPNEEVALYFSAADLVLAPYRRVTGSGAAQMARGFGVPVVTTSVGERQEIIIAGETGMLVPPGDSEALGRAVIHFLTAGSGGAFGPDKERLVSGWQQLIDLFETAAQSSARCAP